MSLCERGNTKNDSHQTERRSGCKVMQMCADIESGKNGHKMTKLEMRDNASVFPVNHFPGNQSGCQIREKSTQDSDKVICTQVILVLR